MTGSRDEARAFGASCEGRHPGGRPGNQDAYGVRSTPARAAIAVADGHGSPTCFRSDVGARIAVEVALDLYDRDLTDLAALARESEQVRVRRALAERWRERVLAHLAETPYDAAEFAANAAPGRAAELRALMETEPTLAYGSTLLLAAADRERVVYVQIGDGDTFAVTRDADVRAVFPKPATMLSNETYSLCQPDAWQYVRLAVQERAVEETAFVLAATDGFANAFAASPAARDRVAALATLLARDDDDARDELARLAASASAASLDDATLAMLVPPRADTAPAAAPPQAEQARTRTSNATRRFLVSGAAAVVFAIAAALYGLGFHPASGPVHPQKPTPSRAPLGHEGNGLIAPPPALPTPFAIRTRGAHPSPRPSAAVASPKEHRP